MEWERDLEGKGSKGNGDADETEDGRHGPPWGGGGGGVRRSQVREGNGNCRAGQGMGRKGKGGRRGGKGRGPEGRRQSDRTDLYNPFLSGLYLNDAKVGWKLGGRIPSVYPAVPCALQ